MQKSIFPPLKLDPITAYSRMTGCEFSELAKKTGIHRVYLHRLSERIHEITDDMAKRLAKGSTKPASYWKLPYVVLRAYTN